MEVLLLLLMTLNLHNMKNKLTLILCLISVCAYSQIDTATNRRTTVIGQLPKIITDAHLRAASSLSIPYVASTTPSMNGAINRAGYGLQLLSNLRLAVGIGASSFSQFMGVTELTAALALKANLASPTFTGTPTTATPATNVNTTQIVNGVWVNTYFQTLANLSTDLTSSATKYPSVNAVNTGLALKADITAISSYPYLTKTANYTVLLADWNNTNTLTIIVDATAGNVVITLPTASTVAGKMINVKKIDASVNTVTVSATQNIDGATTLLMAMQYGNAQIQSISTQYITL